MNRKDEEILEGLVVLLLEYMLRTNDVISMSEPNIIKIFSIAIRT